MVTLGFSCTNKLLSYLPSLPVLLREKALLKHSSSPDNTGNHSLEVFCSLHLSKDAEVKSGAHDI